MESTPALSMIISYVHMTGDTKNPARVMNLKRWAVSGNITLAEAKISPNPHAVIIKERMESGSIHNVHEGYISK